MVAKERVVSCVSGTATPSPGAHPFLFYPFRTNCHILSRMRDALKTAMNYVAARAESNGRTRRGGREKRGSLPANGDENKRRRENGRGRTGLSIATIGYQSVFVVCVIVNTHRNGYTG